MRNTLIAILLSLAAPLAPTLQAAEDLVIADFEGNDYGAWQVTGTAFGPGPARGTLTNQMKVEGFLGHGLVNTYHQGDTATGTLTSPPFRIERPHLKFLIGGGGFDGKTCLNLLVDGRIVRTATGPNTRPGGSERLDWQGWDVREFAGQPAVIQIVDAATGGWGHLNVDQIVLSEQSVPAVIQNATRTVTLGRRYLNLPVKTGAPMKRVTVSVSGQAPRAFDIELADGAPDWWAFIDVSPFQGRQATIQANKLREDSSGLSSIHQSDDLKGADNLYREPLRPQFHFSSRRGWNNDPNGLVFYKGEYHLFYQHNPYGWSWGNMHWGHAVSPDLVHWQELPEALYPDDHGTMFSGSAVVDWQNTAGFQTTKEKPLICIFTAAGKPFTQGLAFSNDRGRTWTKYQNNPVLPHQKGENRDPKVIWYQPGKKWVMALYLDGSTYGLFTSADLKTWDKLSEINIPGTSECPELFEIPVEGRPRQTRWIFYGGNGRYLVGSFDGITFKPESGPHALHQGNCWYASQTFNDIPARDGRRILIPWGTIALPGMPFNQMMGIPVELRLKETPAGLRLAASPVKELASLRTRRLLNQRSQPLSPGSNPLSPVKAELLDLVLDLGLGQATELRFNLRGVTVLYDVARQEIRVNKLKAGLKPVDGRIQLRMLVDRTSLDIFGDAGHLYLPVGAILAPDNLSYELSAVGGAAVVHSLEAHQLKSAWR